jgi:hypothetical protein
MLATPTSIPMISSAFQSTFGWADCLRWPADFLLLGEPEQ